MGSSPGLLESKGNPLNYRWTPKKPSDKAIESGCEQVAQAIKNILGGGTAKKITPKIGTFLPGVKGVGPGAAHEFSRWCNHTVVVKDGRVYDAITGVKGLPTDEYKSLWQYAGDINWGF